MAGGKLLRPPFMAIDAGDTPQTRKVSFGRIPSSRLVYYIKGACSRNVPPIKITEIERLPTGRNYCCPRCSKKNRQMPQTDKPSDWSGILRSPSSRVAFKIVVHFWGRSKSLTYPQFWGYVKLKCLRGYR